MLKEIDPQHYPHEHIHRKERNPESQVNLSGEREKTSNTSTTSTLVLLTTRVTDNSCY